MFWIQNWSDFDFPVTLWAAFWPFHKDSPTKLAKVAIYSSRFCPKSCSNTSNFEPKLALNECPFTSKFWSKSTFSDKNWPWNCWFCQEPNVFTTFCQFWAQKLTKICHFLVKIWSQNLPGFGQNEPVFSIGSGLRSGQNLDRILSEKWPKPGSRWVLFMGQDVAPKDNNII